MYYACGAGSLGWKSYARFGVWLVVSMVVYVLYSMHRADAKDLNDDQRCVHSPPLPLSPLPPCPWFVHCSRASGLIPETLAAAIHVL